MTLQEAITARHSVRQYKDIPIEADKIALLQNLIDECNNEGGLHIQLVINEPNAFSGGLAKYGKFAGVKNYIAMICRRGDDTLLGYYGEKIVLYAQTLGLNTCWVGLTYRNQPDKYEICEGEVMPCVISLGYGATQGVQHPQKKSFNDFVDDKRCERSDKMPDWFVRGVNAAMLAPTAINQQKFVFTLYDANIVEAKTRFTILNSYAPLDLGIVKFHFELAAGKDNFKWK